MVREDYADSGRKPDGIKWSEGLGWEGEGTSMRCGSLLTAACVSLQALGPRPHASQEAWAARSHQQEEVDTWPAPSPSSRNPSTLG